MARSRAVSALFLSFTSILAASGAGAVSAASNAFKTTVTFPKAVQLAEGSVVKANVPYEFQINFAGSGKTAEFEFTLPGGKHVKQPAEAVGFSGAGGEPQVWKGWDVQKSVATQIKWDYYAKQTKGATTEWVKVPSVRAEDEYKYKVFEGDIKNADKSSSYLKIKFSDLSTQKPAEPFSWSTAGFGPSTHPKTTEEGGLIIVVVPSSNSPAFFKSKFKLDLSPPKPASAPMNKN